MNEKLFVYGLLKNPKIQKQVIGRVVEGKSDILEGYKKSEIEIDNEVFPIIEPDPEGSIEGFLLLVTPQELKLIDEYETSAYKRKRVKLKSGIIAWVYQNP